MFDLGSPERLQELDILDCGSGPASFTTELNQRGGQVLACDPLYQFTTSQIRDRIQDTYDLIMTGVRENLDRYLWTQIPSPEELGQVRMQAMERFLSDLSTHPDRYVIGELPVLPFESRQFDLALCSHLLFTYSQQLSLDLHLQGILELCRVAQEVRIFPLLTLAGDPSPHLDPVLLALREQGFSLQVEPVPYQFQKGGDRMLRISQQPL